MINFNSTNGCLYLGRSVMAGVPDSCNKKRNAAQSYAVAVAWHEREKTRVEDLQRYRGNPAISDMIERHANMAAQAQKAAEVAFVLIRQLRRAR